MGFLGHRIAMPGSRELGFALGMFFLVPLPSEAAEQLRFQFEKGQILRYQIEQSTKAVNTASDEKTELSSQTTLVKRWEVTGVDADGVATVEMSFVRIAITQKLPDGKAATFDSEQPNKEGTDDGLKKAMSEMIGKPLVVLRVGRTGAVVEVKKADPGPASRYQSELPFAIVLPPAEIEANQTWKRAYKIVLDPPIGTGEKYDAEQEYLLKSIEGDRAVITFTTSVKNPPERAEDRLPLLQFQPRGAVNFDRKRGIMLGATVISSGTVEGHQGEGSKYEFQMEYKEQLMAD